MFVFLYKHLVCHRLLDPIYYRTELSFHFWLPVFELLCALSSKDSKPLSSIGSELKKSFVVLHRSFMNYDIVTVCILNVIITFSLCSS